MESPFQEQINNPIKYKIKCSFHINLGNKTNQM